MQRWYLSALLIFLPFVTVGCPKRIPETELEEARAALEAARRAKADRCAQAAFHSANEMVEKAQKQVEEKDYEGARTTALAAKKLAESAQGKARTSDECKEKDAISAQTSHSEEREGGNQIPDFISRSMEDQGNLGESGTVKTVFFEYNEFVLSEETRRILQENAQLLRTHKGKIEISGHCDERGSTEYNLALGEKRAISVQNYLMSLGVNPDQLRVVSYGEERPLIQSTNDDAYAKNRRAEFRLFESR